MSTKFNTESELSSYKILKLNLKAEPFWVMLTGEKNFEYRDIKKWTNSRLFNKDETEKQYDFVKFTLSYGSDKPFFICEYKGFSKIKNVHVKYSTGFEVNFEDERWAIKLGEIVLAGNIKNRQGALL